MCPYAVLPDGRIERRARFVDYRRTGRTDLRDRLVRRHMPLAERIARRYRLRGVPDDDLLQTASVGLIHAVDRFDPDRGVPFEAFASPTIAGEIKRHFRDRAWDLHVPRRVQQRYLAINAAIGRLAQRNGCAPTVDELAREVGTSIEKVVEALEAGAAFNADSLARPWDGEGGRTLTDTLAADDTWLFDAVNRLLVDELLALLPAREQLVVHLRFWEGLSQSGIADRLGISQMHVSRLLRRSYERLRTFLDDVV